MIPIEYKKLVLGNGATIVAERHTHVRSVAIGVWVKVGSSYDPPSQSGISHFIEHMVFKGTEKRSALELATVLESLGGDLNAFTDREYTCYHATVLHEHLSVALDVLSDLVTGPTFEKSQIERERKVLFQELSMVQDSPEEWIQDVFFQTIWKDHPLGQTIIGSKKTIAAITQNHLLQFFEQHYRGENVIVSVSGNISFDELFREVEKYFVFSSKQTALPLRPSISPKYFARRKSVAANSLQLQLLIGFEAMGFRHPRRFDALILSFFLGGGMSSRLFQEIREKAALAYSVDCDYSACSGTGVLTITAGVSQRSLKPCLAIIAREIERLKSQPLTQTELNLVKGQLKGTISLSADQMESRQESLGRNEIVFGRHVPVDEVVTEIERVTPEGVHKLVAEVFVPSKQTLLAMSSKKIRLEGLGVV